MVIVANLLHALAAVLDMVLTLAMFVVIARAILSWVSPDPYNPIVRIINQLTEPILFPIRRRVPYMGGVDLSPIIVLLVIFFLQNFLIKSIHDIAYSLGG